MITRFGNHSAFNGYRFTPSTYSAVVCLRCGAHWRTKSCYVDVLHDRAPHEINIAPGIKGYDAWMETFGRTPL